MLSEALTRVRGDRQAEGEGHRGRPATNNDDQQPSGNENLMTQLIRENASMRNRVQEVVWQRKRVRQGWRNEQFARKALEARLAGSDKSAQALKDDLEECRKQVLQLQTLPATPDSEIRVFAEIATIDWGKERSPLLENYLSGEHLAPIELYPGAESTMVPYMMYRHRHGSIFVDSMYHDCIHTSFNERLEVIGEGLKKLKPKRTEEKTENWRADTRRVLQELPELAKQRKREGVQRDADACKGLMSFARGFKDTVDISPKKYVCKYDFQLGDTIASRGLFDNDSNNFDVINAETDAKVRSKNKLRPDGKGCYGLKLCVIHPSLKGMTTKGGRKVTLVKATILTNLFE